MPLMTPPGIKTLLCRHRVVVLLALVMAGLFSCSTPQEAPPPAMPPAQAQPRPVFMQIVAHQDDDVLFMNPDVSRSIRGGAPTITVYVTAGESDAADPAGYAASRQAGARAAYARMAGVPDEWRADTVGSDRQVERYTLAARPEIQLIFVNLPDNNDKDPKLGGAGALTKLWRDAGTRARTVVPTGGVVHQSYEYSRGDLVSLLRQLIERARPTLVRIQDVRPDRRYTANWPPYHDHPDHVTTARFASEAVRAYRAGGANPRVIQVGYRDYNTEEAPINLSLAQQQEKIDLFAVYGAHDPMVFYTGSYDAWPRRMYYRWPLGTTWVALDAHDRVQAFLVQSGEVLTWWQEADGGWAGPLSLGDAGGVLAPTVSVARDGTGRLTVVARRLDDDELVTLTQNAPGEPRSWPTRWESLGNPNQNAGRDAHAELGSPLAVAAPTGTLAVFVRNAAGGVSTRAQQTPGGAWERDWVKLDGTDVQDGLAAISRNGGIELFAASRQRVLRWGQRGQDGPFELDSAFPSQPPAGPPVVCGDGTVVYKRAGTGEVVVGDTVIPGATGPGGLAASCASPEVLVFARNPAGAVIMSSSASAGWVELGGADLVDQPVVVRDGSGRTVLLGEGADGRLMVTVRQPRENAFGGWQAVGH